MVCNPTSCARRRGAFTLVEYLFATSIGLVVLTAALLLWAYGTKTCASLLGYVELAQSSKLALDRISQQVRNARQVESCSPTSLTLLIPGFTGVHPHRMIYSYDSTNHVLRQTFKKNPGHGETTTLLTECTNFYFQVFQRTPSNNFVLHTNAWNTNTAKVVQMNWTCIRKVTGSQSAIEKQVSAMVVIRNK